MTSGSGPQREEHGGNKARSGATGPRGHESEELLPSEDTRTPNLTNRTSYNRGSRIENKDGGIPHPAQAGGAKGAAVAQANMFADADAMMGKIHENIDKKDYDVADYYHEKGIFQAIAKSNKFGSLTLLVISINALWIGLDAECNDPSTEEEISICPFQAQDKPFWAAGEHAFCTFFTFELTVRFMAFAKKMSALRDNWFKFDSVLVFFMVFETWILPLATGGNGDALSDFALLRMLRLLRLTRMVRLMRSVPELMTLMKGMVYACRSVSYTLLLLIIFMYIFAIIFKSQLADTKDKTLFHHFSGIPRSMWTLLISGCLLDDITTIANLLVKEGVLMVSVFIGFVLLSSLMVLNMLIGVLCAVVAAVAAAEKEKALVSYVKASLITVLETLDTDGNGTISKKEFDALINIPEAVQALDELGVDVPNLVSLSDHLFAGEEDDGPHGFAMSSSSKSKSSLDDEEGRTKDEGPTMTFAEFLEMVIRLRAENPPSVADIVELRKLIFKGQRLLTRRLNHVEKGQHEIQRGVRMMCEQLDSALTLSMSVQKGQSGAAQQAKQREAWDHPDEQKSWNRSLEPRPPQLGLTKQPQGSALAASDESKFYQL